MIFKIKAFILDRLVAVLVSHSDFMESRWFLKAMKIFPEIISSTYDDSIAKDRSSYQDVIEVGLLQIQEKPGRILDLCTGTGVATLIANQVFPNTPIVSIDQSEGMLKMARSKIERLGFSNIEFKLGNVRRLLEPDSSFDLIITSNAPVYLSEIERVLTPSGKCLITFSFGGHSFCKIKDEVSKYLNKFGLSLVDLDVVGQGVFIISERIQPCS